MLVFSPRYNTDLREYGFDKPFALDRAELVLQALKAELGHPVEYTEAQAITLADAGLIHSSDYLKSLEEDEVWKEIFELKPEDMLERADAKPLHLLLDDLLLKSGGTLQAARSAFKDKLSCNLGGGYHHAFPDKGRGFCVVNDIAIAIKKIQKEGLAQRVIIVDLDFHQGDGNALIFRHDQNVFTLSVHSEEGWPEEKQESDLDVPIFSHEQSTYLERTKKALDTAFSQFDPQLCIYVAGSDPYEHDVLPGTRFLRLSLDTMRKRDEFIIDTFYEKNIPLAMVFAGGYGPEVWRVHHQAVRHMLYRLGQIS